MDKVLAEKVDQFFSTYPQRSYPKGQILIFGGEDPDYIHYLVKGRVRQYDISYRGEEVVVNTFKPPAFFPMSWAINRTPNRYFYKTEVETKLHVIPPDDAVKFIKDNPDVLFNLLSRIYRGTEGMMGQIVHLMSGTAKSRLVYVLIIECRRFGKPSASGSYKLEINESNLASRAGLSRETVSREMHKLKAEHLVKVEKGVIVVTNLKAMEETLGMIL